MYLQVDDISMGSPLDPILANIFVGFYEKLLFNRFLKPYIYLRYLDDTFACFCPRNKALSFFQCLNNLHPSLTFTMDEEKDYKPLTPPASSTSPQSPATAREKTDGKFSSEKGTIHCPTPCFDSFLSIQGIEDSRLKRGLLAASDWNRNGISRKK